ncbi:hypothetical protein TSUD_395160 [Trifolium subterraneum]|uniref:Retrotransposon gag domain-containing protein n=1 Tax=Trifolium subterraneum TaxID=3900 RepID=A0A2Z6NN80_TRISU|nr:hypothetical protein TSUD_395160 [Trifolium subterraneum]
MTRSQSVSELEKKVDDRHAELEKKVDDHHADVHVRFDQLASQMDELRTMLGKSSNHHDSDGSSGRHSSSHTPNSYATRISKVDFPRFNGKNIRDWLYKCDQFFLLDTTPATSMVRLASIHLDDLALQWHLNYMRQKFNIYPIWGQYVTDITARFGDAFEDPLSSLLQVKHSGKVQDYIDQFQLALTQVNLIPEHSLSIFLAGLEYHKQMHVRMFNPSSIAHAVNLAKLHESSKEIITYACMVLSHWALLESPSPVSPVTELPSVRDQFWRSNHTAKSFLLKDGDDVHQWQTVQGRHRKGAQKKSDIATSTSSHNEHPDDITTYFFTSFPDSFGERKFVSNHVRKEGMRSMRDEEQHDKAANKRSLAGTLSSPGKEASRSFAHAKAFVGVVHEPSMTYNIQSAFHRQGYFGVKVTPLGANLALLEGQEDGEVKTLMEDAKGWMDQCYGRLLWAYVYHDSSKNGNEGRDSSAESEEDEEEEVRGMWTEGDMEERESDVGESIALKSTSNANIAQVNSSGPNLGSNNDKEERGKFSKSVEGVRSKEGSRLVDGGILLGQEDCAGGPQNFIEILARSRKMLRKTLQQPEESTIVMLVQSFSANAPFTTSRLANTRAILYLGTPRYETPRLTSYVYNNQYVTHRNRNYESLKQTYLRA